MSLINELVCAQVFVVGSKDGQLYHIWQSERDGSWSDWEALGHLPSGQLVSQPTLAIDENGWWQAYAVSVVHDQCVRWHMISYSHGQLDLGITRVSLILQ